MMRSFLNLLMGVVLVALSYTAGTASAKITPEAFGVLPAVYDAAISPDGKRLAVIVNVDGRYGVSIIDLDGRSQEPRGYCSEKTSNQNG